MAFDVDAGLVTMEAAKKRYGVVLTDDCIVDEKRTKTLRTKLSKARGKTKLFDFGGTIPELKARCKKETGLEPPAQPEFPTWFHNEQSKAVKKRTKRKAKAKAKAKAKPARKTKARKSAPKKTVAKKPKKAA